MRTPPSFDLERVVRSHGWYDLAPWSWDPVRRVVGRPLRLAPGRVVHVEVAAPGPGRLLLRVTAPGGTARAGQGRAAEAEAVRHAVRTCLALDEDLGPFRERARAVEGVGGPTPVQGALDRGLGRLLRSPTVFEDAVKTLCTTNCSWALTRSMVSRLVESLGEQGPSGRAFPAPEALASRPERFFRDRVRAGYRAPFLRSLARDVARGALDPESWRDPSIPAAELRRRILALDGFGPYAAEHLMRLLGRHEGLALDSWTRKKIAGLRGRKRVPADRTFARWYAPWGEWAGLAMWLEATADWHGDAPAWP
ncbi:MAG TPA: Fe-S cluster assembly protein HesB [Anaeromyxobacteraceae bacterium]|nr:Fe-S cluster assembly protein HesB [Anaeromyxobacteraceae bacterium]